MSHTATPWSPRQERSPDRYSTDSWAVLQDLLRVFCCQPPSASFTPHTPTPTYTTSPSPATVSQVLPNLFFHHFNSQTFYTLPACVLCLSTRHQPPSRMSSDIYEKNKGSFSSPPGTGLSTSHLCLEHIDVPSAQKTFQRRTVCDECVPPLDSCRALAQNVSQFPYAGLSLGKVKRSGNLKKENTEIKIKILISVGIFSQKMIPRHCVYNWAHEYVCARVCVCARARE